MSFKHRSFVDRVSTYLVDHVAPCLPARDRSRDEQAHEEIQRQAQIEMQAQIDKGRPGPEEGRRTRPRPVWAQPRPRASRPLDVMAVNLEALPHAAPAGERLRAIRREPTG